MIRCSECYGEAGYTFITWDGMEWEPCRTCEGNGFVTMEAHWTRYVEADESIPWFLDDITPQEGTPHAQ